MARLIVIFLSIIDIATTKIVNVTRGESDNFSPLDCSCFEYSSAYCNNPIGQCCKSCMCEHGKSLSSNNGELVCVNHPADEKGCDYYLWGSRSSGQSIYSAKVYDNAENTIGYVKNSQTEKKFRSCEIFESNSMYWDIKKWSPLFIDDRKVSDFNFGNQGGEVTLKINTATDLSLYRGLLIQLSVECKRPNRKAVPESCMMFKVFGTAQHWYDTNSINGYAGGKGKTTLPPISGTPNTEATSHDQHHIIIIVLVVLFVVFIIVTVILFCCWRKRKREMSRKSFIRNTTQQSRKLLLQKSMDETELVYQAPEKMNGKKIEVSSKEYGNPTYLQPVDNRKSKGDMKEPTNGDAYIDPGSMKAKAKKNTSYDYPQLQITPMDKDKAKLLQNAESKHEYADIGIDDSKESSKHHYIDPDIQREKRYPSYSDAKPETNSAHHYIDPDNPASSHHYIDPDKCKENSSAHHYIDPDQQKVSPAHHYIDPDACIEKFLANKDNYAALSDANCSDSANTATENVGYADLKETPTNTGYAALDNSQTNNEGNYQKKDHPYFELEPEVPI